MNPTRHNKTLPASRSGTLPEPPSPDQPGQSSWLAMIWEAVQIVVLALLMVMFIRNFVQNFRIDGISMEPNFHNGQFLIVNRWAYCPGIHLEIPIINKKLWEKTWCVRQPRRGDVVIFEYPRDPSRDFIKRVIGLPGETVDCPDGKEYVNGPGDAGAVRAESCHSTPHLNRWAGRGLRDGGQPR